MTLSFLYRAFCRILRLIRLVGRRDTDLAIEVVILRHEVAVLRRPVHRPALEPADRAVLAGLARLLPRRRHGHLFVQPATLLRRHRDLVAKRWTYSNGRPVRPSIAEGTTAVALRLAKENPTWGYRRVHGELASMGVVIAPSHHDTRRVRIAGITANPVAAWVTQQARNLSMELADQANPVEFLAHPHQPHQQKRYVRSPRAHRDPKRLAATGLSANAPRLHPM